MDICSEQMPDHVKLDANHRLPAGWPELGKMEKVLEVDQLTKVFFLGNVLSRVRITAADHVSFYVKPAEIFALAGESGCGKTTTARMVLGFETPTSARYSTAARGLPDMKRCG